MMNNFPTHGDLNGWVKFLASGDLPMLASTQDNLSQLKLKDESLLPGDLAAAALRDPLLTTTILRYIQDHRNKLRTIEITTVEHAIMMMGIEPFFRAFGSTATVEELLQGKQKSIEAIRKISKRSYVASRLAQDWAAKSKDMESEETQVAALMRDVAEMLLWIKAPGHAISIKKMMDENPQIRSATAQSRFIGIPLVNIEIELCRKWGLPETLIQLLQGKKRTTRTMQVDLAVKLARHSATDWDNRALPDDWDFAASILGFETPEDAERELRLQVATLVRKWDMHNHENNHLP